MVNIGLSIAIGWLKSLVAVLISQGKPVAIHVVLDFWKVVRSINTVSHDIVCAAVTPKVNVIESCCTIPGVTFHWSNVCPDTILTVGSTLPILVIPTVLPAIYDIPDGNAISIESCAPEIPGPIFRTLVLNVFEPPQAMISDPLIKLLTAS